MSETTTAPASATSAMDRAYNTAPTPATPAVSAPEKPAVDAPSGTPLVPDAPAAQPDQPAENIPDKAPDADPGKEKDGEEEDAFLKSLGLTTTEEPSAEVADAKPAFDGSAFKEILGREVSSPDELLNDLKSLKEKEKHFQEYYTGVPDELKDIVEIARSGGDYKAVLDYATFDYNSIPPSAYVKDDLIALGIFPNTPEGLQAAADYVESQDPTMINLQGSQLRNARIAEQKAFVQEKKNKAVQTKLEMDTQLRSTLDNLKSFAGVDLTASLRNKYYDQISKGTVLIRDEKTGKPDFTQTVQLLHLKENFQNIVKRISSHYKSAGTKEVLAQASFPNIARNTPPVNIAESQPKSAMDRHWGG